MSSMSSNSSSSVVLVVVFVVVVLTVVAAALALSLLLLSSTARSLARSHTVWSHTPTLVHLRYYQTANMTPVTIL